MNNETGQEIHVVINRKDYNSANYDQISEALIDEAKKEGLTPCDLNWNGRPNIYLRGRYEIDGFRKNFIEDIFIMFVKKDNLEAKT
jgi:hypothetical protein